MYPGYRMVSVEPLAPDSGATKDSTSKVAGYGMPERIALENEAGDSLELVWRVPSSNEFGHDRPSDRAAGILLASEDFPRIPDHVQAVDIGAIRDDGELISIRNYRELYLITTYARGEPYAEDLRRIARTGHAEDRDSVRVDTLARYLAALHVPMEGATRYRRAIRDLVGDGEGIFGVIDGYPADVAGAPPSRLQAIERRCVEWRWRLRDREGRLCRTHGDFHPFNVVFDEDHLALLDASRGTCGDPADDLTAMAVNFVLFALDTPDGWRGLGPLWHRFWRTYVSLRPDPALTEVAPPYFAWRALVVCNPKFYPGLSGAAREALLGLAERALDAHHLDPVWADELFR